MSDQPLFPMRATGLVYRDGGQSLINGIALTLTDSPITMVMGANGAGKSLLLRLLHGLLPLTAGRIEWASQLPDAQVRCRQAMVFQRPVLLRRSVAANIDFVLSLRPLSRSERSARCAELLDQAGLLHLAAQPARLLSGGEQQRLALARALATEPAVLFLDEPTASLDPASVVAIEKRVRAAADAGTKIIFVTHELGQARRLADDIVFLHRGQLSEHTDATHFFDRPSSDAACAYVDGQLYL